MKSVKHCIHIFFILIITLVYTGPLTAQEKAYPKNGEGIILFLKRFNRTGQTYQKEFIKLNKGKFGKNNSLRMGVKYTLPPLKAKRKRTATASASSESPVSTPRRRNYQSLFGKSLASYQVTSSDLKGACFYLVSGHGGPDPGAIGKMGSHELHEDEYAYDIMLRLARNLLTRGAKVHIIIQDAKDGIRDQQFLNNSKRETCMGSPIPFNQVSRLEQRCAKINTLNRKDKETYKRAIFIHVDSRSKHQRTDVFFYHKPKDQASKRLAKTMKSTFSHKYNRHQPGRGFSGTVDDRNLYVLRHTVPTSVFVELGNLQNRYDQQRFILSNNRQALANWLCEGFITDYNYYKKTKK
ncbi:N-acetylmuramoyl-L-alanine amidase [uncultured Parabacteroides sp.]|uniref:N-acetylmuramoyl-L-alanine amidase family protein n=1 Tax=uncultured Parabacteroides sp. TaxID=512312 RepID=UPI00263213F6|nr:N-acetylmuramoyl-L-alanine amidase [uncultured Parabacteroides sp.]